METVITPKGTTLPLLNLRGKLYLQVQHRVIWFREEYPLGKIETTEVERTANHAIYKATISIPWNSDYKILAQGTKYESKENFNDFIEKAETGAIGRALANAGYGTQFAVELDEGERIVDAPIHNPPPRGPMKVPERPLSSIQKPNHFDTGKYKGKSFQEVYENNKAEALAYVDWIKRQPNPTSEFSAFAEFVQIKHKEFVENGRI